ncbi:hypothetical protein F7G09_27700 [Escherichia coli]|nr:hypothetical protein F7G09_27700 [Escherichia coli]
MHFRVTGEWNGEPFNRVIEAENINDCYDHWMIWAQIAHADITNIRIEELKEHQAEPPRKSWRLNSLRKR